MFEMGAETMRLPLEEKMQYEQGDEGSSFGQVSALRQGCRVRSYHSSVLLATRRQEPTRLTKQARSTRWSSST